MDMQGACMYLLQRSRTICMNKYRVIIRMVEAAPRSTCVKLKLRIFWHIRFNVTILSCTKTEFKCVVRM